MTQTDAEFAAYMPQWFNNLVFYIPIIPSYLAHNLPPHILFPLATFIHAIDLAKNKPLSQRLFIAAAASLVSTALPEFFERWHYGHFQGDTLSDVITSVLSVSALGTLYGRYRQTYSSKKNYTQSK